MNNFRFTLEDIHDNVYSQFRQEAHFEDFLADFLNNTSYGEPFAWEIKSVQRHNLRNGEIVELDTPDALIKVLEDTRDELEFRKHEINETISDIEIALNDLGKK